jgi:hypothetical protein
VTQAEAVAALEVASADLAALTITGQDTLTADQLDPLNDVIEQIAAAVLVVLASDPPPLPAQTVGVQGRQTSTMGAWTTLP